MTADAVLDALGNPARRTLLRLLAAGPQPVGVLASHLPISRPAVSKHLQVLESAGLVAHDRAGTRSLYHLDPTGFDAAHEWLNGFWDQALARFALVANNLQTPEAPQA